MMRRYPLEPLRQLTGWSVNRINELAPCNGTEYRLRMAEGVTERIAERLAVAAGFVPYEVWPEMLDVAIEAVKVECAAEDCTERFVPSQPSQRYCCGACSSRHRRRVRYQTDPEYRSRRRAASAAYYATCGESVRRRNRAAKAVYRNRAARTEEAA